MILKEYEGFTSTISNIYPSWIDITNSEHNQEVALDSQELTSALPSQRPSQVHLLRSTLHDYQSLPQFILICKSFWTIFYPLLFCDGHHVLPWVATNSDTTHPQAM